MEENLNPTPTQETPEISETPPAPEEEQFSPTPARSKKWYIIGAALIIFLALAAFFGARLLRTPSEEAAAGKGGMFFSSKGGPGASKSVRIDMTRAKEVPPEKADTMGLFVRREDQSVFIGTGNVRMLAKPGKNGSADVSGNYDGPVKEVVVTHDTKVYQDITDMNPGNVENGGTMKVQQVVKPGSLDDLGQNSLVTVWGDKQGDRYIAKVLVFR